MQMDWSHLLVSLTLMPILVSIRHGLQMYFKSILNNTMVLLIYLELPSGFSEIHVTEVFFKPKKKRKEKKAKNIT